MNRYDWLLLAFRVFFNSSTIKEVEKMVSTLETNPKSGESKRDFVTESILPMTKNVSVFILRALIEVVLAKLRTTP